eukprot:gnl/Dysnectes_brevis/191_a220_12458.p1 GENE.gnl/Dysnectes_brevis/191_a220_12458~~gnl/Dysnectes_brevis/191_a220_12458.p1  ORF type:complete len:142 (+),score=27.72 gnl/Dysnectes_brevis/191_a220_12458:31-456(+)
MTTIEETAVAPENLSPIASPLAGPKLTSRALKLVEKAKKDKNVKRGVKEVQKAIRKGSRGICILAGDISPIHVVAHLPVYCEKHNIPYFFIDSKRSLGKAASTRRSTSVVLIEQGENYQKEFEKVMKKAQNVMKDIQKYYS